MTDSPWSYPEVVDFYAGHRCRVEDLYETERSLLEPALQDARSVLDFGCAAGGFLPILQELRPGIRYTGVDRSAQMIRKARALHTDGEFRRVSGPPLPFRSRSFDLVLATGVLHHNPDYRKWIRELYRISAAGCLLDLPRLSVDSSVPPRASHQSLQEEFSIGHRTPERRSRVPYLVIPPRPLFEFLLNELVPRPRAIAVAGKVGPPTPAAKVPSRKVCFCVVYLAKGNGEATRKTDFWIGLPRKVACAAGLFTQARRLRGSRSLAEFFRRAEGSR